METTRNILLCRIENTLKERRKNGDMGVSFESSNDIVMEAQTARFRLRWNKGFPGTCATLTRGREIVSRIMQESQASRRKRKRKRSIKHRLVFSELYASRVGKIWPLRLARFDKKVGEEKGEYGRADNSGTSRYTKCSECFSQFLATRYGFIKGRNKRDHTAPACYGFFPLRPPPFSFVKSREKLFQSRHVTNKHQVNLQLLLLFYGGGIARKSKCNLLDFRSPVYFPLGFRKYFPLSCSSRDRVDFHAAR